MAVIDPRRTGLSPPVLWTRGAGCAELAELLSDAEPVRVRGDLTEECIRHRASLLVSRRLSNFDLASMAVPVDFTPEGTETVVAAVAGGPHSPLAAQVAQRLGKALGLDALMVCAFREDEERERSVSLIENLYQIVPGIEYRLVEAQDAGGLVNQLPERSLLVLGAPGGNWFQRTIFGQGVKLRHRAPMGAVVVRKAPTRVFQVMADPVFVAPLREAVDIPRIHDEELLAVVDRAKLVGVVRRDALALAEPGVPVFELMEDSVSVPVDATLEEAASLRQTLSAGPIPVIDEGGTLVGCVPD